MTSISKLLLTLTAIIFIPLNLISQKTDPYHLSSGGFGYSLEGSLGKSIWWCEGAYKVMHDTPLPSATGDTVRLWSAGNEYEAFQLVINTDTRVEDIRLNITDLVSEGHIIDNQFIEIRKVEYVEISKSTDGYGYPAYWPDPLPPAVGPTTAYGGENTTFWINIYVPGDATSGIYRGTINIGNRSWESSIPIILTVWDFLLPEIPSMRSGFGLSVDKIAKYHNLKLKEDIRETFDLYMKAFRDYKIAPYDPFYLDPIMVKVSGLAWKGGIFDFNNSYNGDYSLMIQDDNPAASPAAEYKEAVEVDPSKKYVLRWNIKGGEDNQQYCILLEGYNQEGKKLIFENKMEVFTCDTSWKGQEFQPGIFGDDVSHVRLSIFPSFRTATGEAMGTIWIDNVVFSLAGGKTNLLKQFDFEINPDSIDIELDFSDFDKAGIRYLDDFGFNSFRLYLKGMGSGTYYSREEGVFEGFKQGSPVYTDLMDKYLRRMEEHLEERGWLGKEYVYWFDEPGKKDYHFVREGMETIKKSAPRINTFLTENEPGPEILDVTDISCTIFHRVDPEKAREVVSSGQEYWSYLCTAPKAPWLSLFIDHDAINMRMWSWITYAWGLNGILVWSTNYWDSYSASPEGYLQNPWTEPASYVQGYGWPYGKQTLWGNGDGRLFYPPNRDPNNDSKIYICGPVPSLRLEFLRQGLEDYEYLVMLDNLISKHVNQDNRLIREAKKLLKLEGKIFTDGKAYTKDPQDLLEARKKIAYMISELKKSN